MSGSRVDLRAAVSAALLVSLVAAPAGAQVTQQTAAAPAPATGRTGTLPSGVAYEVRPDPGQSGAAVALWYRAPAAGFDGTPTPGLSRLTAATVAASAPITGTPLAQLVGRFGGELRVGAAPDSVSITALVPADRVAQTVRAMTADYFAPVVTDEGLETARSDSRNDALLRGYTPDAIEDALGRTLFADGPLHDGTIGTPDAIAQQTISRVRAYAERAFRPVNALLVLTGNVDPAVLANVASRAGESPATAGAAEPAAAQTARSPAAAPERTTGFITGTGLGWVGPPIAAESDATALDFIADALFAPRTGSVTRALAGRKASATGKFVTYRNPGLFLVTITGDDAAAARPVVERAIADAATPMAPAAFEAARSAFVYRLLGDTETPAAIADTVGWYEVEGNAAYAPGEGGLAGRYFTVASRLSPAGVAATAAKYLHVPPAVVTAETPAPAASPGPGPSRKPS